MVVPVLLIKVYQGSMCFEGMTDWCMLHTTAKAVRDSLYLCRY